LSGLAAALSLLQDMGQGNNFSGLIVVLFCGAAWIGVQNLGYAELGIAGRVIFQRGLRRTVVAQMCLQQFERDLAKLDTAEGVWEVLSQAANSAGFSAVRMEAAGRIWDSRSPALLGASVWELRIPLGCSDAITLYCVSHNTMHPVMMSGFAEVV
jgi:UDP-GlcNAc:undecaprenyl-phosphate/decaprenyl-phosphate GlcNAc-1-phosphate transferase